jgi:antitoxin (DNA-binding transcriptional repressor) of toxin-antitoxin stability system
MITVSAEQAQRRFGKLLESVSRGERIVVTRKGKPVAELRAPESDDENNWMLTDEEAAKLDKLIAQEEAAGTMRSFSSAEEMVETLRKELKIPKRLFERARKKAQRR